MRLTTTNVSVGGVVPEQSVLAAAKAGKGRILNVSSRVASKSSVGTYALLYIM